MRTQLSSEDDLTLWRHVAETNVSQRTTTCRSVVGCDKTDTPTTCRTCESFVESVAVRSHLTGVSVQTTYLDWVRTARNVDAIQLDVDVVQTALTWHEIHCVAIYRHRHASRDVWRHQSRHSWVTQWRTCYVVHQGHLIVRLLHRPGSRHCHLAIGYCTIRQQVVYGKYLSCKICLLIMHLFYLFKNKTNEYIIKKTNFTTQIFTIKHSMTYSTVFITSNKGGGIIMFLPVLVCLSVYLSVQQRRR